MKKILLVTLLSINTFINCSFDIKNSSLIFEQYDNTGDLISTNSEIIVGICDNSGTFVCGTGNKKSIFKFGEISGNGSIIIQSGKLIMFIEHCLFTGTIECNANCECEIYTLTPKSKLKFKKKGKGKITVQNQLISKL